MPDSNFVNPLANPIFISTLLRTAGVLVVGFILLLILKKLKLRDLLESNIGKIYIGWLILAPLYLLGIFLGGIPSLVVLFVLTALALSEVVRLANLPRIYFITLLFLSVWSIVVASFFSNYFYSLPLFYFVVITAVAIRANDASKGLYNAALSLFASIWIIFALSHGVLLGHLNNEFDTTKSLLVLIVFATSLSDIGAYVFGKLFHKLNFFDQYKIASNISPNKTYIGTLGHILGAAVGIYIVYFAVREYLPFYHWIVLAVLMGVFGLVGGLTNSLFKRYYSSKDSSHLIPGHGGVLDRIDSITRVVVVLYYYLLLFHK